LLMALGVSGEFALHRPNESGTKRLVQLSPKTLRSSSKPASRKATRLAVRPVLLVLGREH
jgi:hypothetical protein